jgi:predicted dehydrogenase
MSKSKKKPIHVGVLGLGRAGWDIHVAGIRNDPRYQIVAVMDGLPERLDQAREEFGCETFKNPKDLLAKTRADLIINAMPSQFHGSLTRAAFQAGCHVAVEKPIARDVKEARSMIRAAKAAKKKLFPHHNYRFTAMVKHLHEVINSGILGDVFEFDFNVAQFARRNDWQTLKKNNGGLLNNHGTHCIDWVMQLMGSPVKDVFSDMKLVADSGNTEDHVRLLLRAQSGCLADFHLSTATNATLPALLILGTCGTLTNDGGTSTIRYFDPKKVKELPVDTRPPAGRRYGNSDKLPWREKTMKVESRDKTTFYDNVYSVIRERGKQVVTPESALEVLKVLDRARVPVKTWRPKYGG